MTAWLIHATAFTHTAPRKKWHGNKEFPARSKQLKSGQPHVFNPAGGMQEGGGLEAINISGHSAVTGVMQDYFGNVIGTIANGAVS